MNAYVIISLRPLKHHILKKTMLYYLGWESIYCSSNSGELVVAAVKQNMQSLISKSLMTRHLN
jgi:hypothetical protein